MWFFQFSTSNLGQSLFKRCDLWLCLEYKNISVFLWSLLACHYFQKCPNILIFWYCGRNVCFSNMPKFQDPTRPPSFQIPSAKFLFKLQLTHENMGHGHRLSEKLKMVQQLGWTFKFNLLFRNIGDEWILPKKTLLFNFFCIPLPPSPLECLFMWISLISKKTRSNEFGRK